MSFNDKMTFIGNAISKKTEEINTWCDTHETVGFVIFILGIVGIYAGFLIYHTIYPGVTHPHPDAVPYVSYDEMVKRAEIWWEEKCREKRIAELIPPPPKVALEGKDDDISDSMFIKKDGNGMDGSSSGNNEQRQQGKVYSPYDFNHCLDGCSEKEHTETKVLMV